MFHKTLRYRLPRASMEQNVFARVIVFRCWMMLNVQHSVCHANKQNKQKSLCLPLFAETTRSELASQKPSQRTSKYSLARRTISCDRMSMTI